MSWAWGSVDSTIKLPDFVALWNQRGKLLAGTLSGKLDKLGTRNIATESGGDTRGVKDSSLAIQGAVRSGDTRLLLSPGAFAITSQIVIDESPTAPPGLEFEGVSRTECYLLAGPPGGSYGATNAMIVNRQTNGKLSFYRLRFAGSGFSFPAFAGYSIYAFENGANSQAIFSGSMTKLWVGLGTTALGFFYGALNNYFVSDSTFEGTNTRFTLIGAGNADIHFENISDYSNFGPFVDASQDAIEKNIGSVRGAHAYSPQSGVWWKANNFRSLTLAHVIYQVSDPATPGTGLGLLDIKDCKDYKLTSCVATRYTGSTANMATVIKIDGGNGEINGQTINGGDTHFAIQGVADVTINGGNFANAVSYIMSIAAGTSGVIRIKNATLQFAGLALIKTLGAGCSFNLEIDDCEILDAGYNAGAPHAAFEIETSGSVLINGKRLGRTAGATSNMNGVLLLTGSGLARVEIKELVGTAPLVDPASTQIPVIELTGTGSPETVHTASPGSRFYRTNGGAATSFYVKETGTGNVGWVGK